MDAIIILGFIAIVAVVFVKRKKPELYETLKSKLKLK
mgnify:CR=1 FL=1|jgi:hypothetical protein|tara:strand:- start:4716 stop:4826 length:111 start_codon:yes stop_codon:yes gene_type:complete